MHAKFQKSEHDQNEMPPRLVPHAPQLALASHPALDGDVDVVALVGPDGDAHVYAPTPADAKKVADARLLAAEYNTRNDRFPVLRLNCADALVAGVLVNTCQDPVAIRFLKE